MHLCTCTFFSSPLLPFSPPFSYIYIYIYLYFDISTEAPPTHSLFPQVIGSTEGAPEGAVYVHCNAGKGRSTSVVLCYLIYVHGMSRVEAYDFVKEKRPKIAKFRALCDTRPQWFYYYYLYCTALFLLLLSL
jgi:protein-tyrosine phosphatase